MQILVSRACGIDVHKDMLAVCVLVYREGAKEPEARYKEFATHQKALTALGNWLNSQKVTHVAMESTGVYWKPVWYALEGHFQLLLANPFQVKALPGKKTDKRDSHWLAELLAHGLMAGSFVPPEQTRRLRDLTRYRVKLSEEMNRIHNRIHKVLEDASIKLDTVVSHILGGTGRSVIEGIMEGKEAPRQLAERAQGSLRGKRAQLELALHGRVSEHHRFMLKELMEDLRFVEAKILRLDQTLSGSVDWELVTHLCTIPGVDVITAWTLLAELGADTRVFANSKKAASWAGLCPGNKESGGKRLSGRTRKGNRWLRRGLCQAAWGASRKKDCFLNAFFQRHKATHGAQKAIIATAHRLLVIAYCILRDGTTYQERGGDFYDQLNAARTRQRLIERLRRLGVEVTISSQAPVPASTALKQAPPAKALASSLANQAPAPATAAKRKRGRPCKCAERQIPCIHQLPVAQTNVATPPVATA
jgi:transposase